MSDYTPRETWYDGIPMRSRLEAGFAQFLDSQNLPWKYEGKAFASRDGQYLPDFVVGDHWYFEVKPEGKGTCDVLERMRIILATDASASLSVVEGIWTNGEYEFRLTHEWPERRPPVTYYVYNVPGCDSWHRLERRPPNVYTDDLIPSEADEAKAVAQAVFPEVDFYYEQEPRLYILPAADAPAGIEIWAVAFHKGDACIVSQIPLPWISDYLVGTTQR